jgi:hypothetical protein
MRSTKRTRKNILRKAPKMLGLASTIAWTSLGAVMGLALLQPEQRPFAILMAIMEYKNPRGYVRPGVEQSFEVRTRPFSTASQQFASRNDDRCPPYASSHLYSELQVYIAS